LGTSLYSQEPVVYLLNSRVWVTLSLVIGSTTIASLVGVVLGIGGALRSGWQGRSIDVIGLGGLAIPNFFLGLVLVSWFAVGLRWLPATGYVPLGASPVQWLRSLVLPVVTLAVPGAAVIAKQTRDSMRQVLDRPFVETLRSYGIPKSSIILKHALRSASVPVVTVIGLVFVASLSGTVVVESVFAMPGLGGLAVEATMEHDFPLILGVAMYFTIAVIAVNLLLDIIYGVLDPRVRVS
jgi:peptide/nickel transport system permease protein